MSAAALASDTAMVMAAGLGKRMRPLTASQPKPLIRVGGKALIDYSLDALAQAGVARAVVNVHYLADALEAHLRARKNGPEIFISDEPLLSDPFFCLNSDNVWLDGPRDVFRELSARWDPDRMDALLLVVSHVQAYNYNGKGDFHLDPMGRITRRRAERVAPYIYTGIQIVSHRLLRDAPTGPFGTMQLWERAIAEERLYGMSHTGLWCEVGKPAAIAPTEALLRRA
jgi:N-acetyl-alpha-D-muramate 1-phosphate uridylyltransferase